MKITHKNKNQESNKRKLSFSEMRKTFARMKKAIRSMQHTPKKSRNKILKAYLSGKTVQWIGVFSNGWEDELPGKKELPFDCFCYRIKPRSLRELDQEAIAE